MSDVYNAFVSFNNFHRNSLANIATNKLQTNTTPGQGKHCTNIVVIRNAQSRVHFVPVHFCVFIAICFLCFSVLMYELYNNNDNTQPPTRTCCFVRASANYAVSVKLTTLY